MRFLKVCDFDLEQALKLLELNLDFRCKNPKLFQNRDFLSDEFQNSFKTFQVFPLPKTTKENYKVIIFRILDTNPDNYSVLELCRMMIALTDIRVVTVDDNDLVEGDVVIVDMQGFGFKHFLKNTTNFSVMKIQMKYMQEALPMRTVQIHHINCSPAVLKLHSICKPFVSKKVNESIKIHSSLQSLYDFIPKEILPKEFEGSSGKSCDELYKDWIDEVVKKK